MNRIRYATLGLLISAPSAMAASPEGKLVGSWSCTTSREPALLRITFKADGTVAGRSQGKQISGRYFREADALSIVGPDQMIAATSLQIAQQTATGNLANGEHFRCHRLR